MIDYITLSHAGPDGCLQLSVFTTLASSTSVHCRKFQEYETYLITCNILITYFRKHYINGFYTALTC